MNYWLFKTNPNIYDIDSRLLDPEPKLSWSVKRYRKEIKIGDIGFIWRAGIPRGIVAVMAIKSDPYYLPFNRDLPRWSGVDKIDGELLFRFPAITPSRTPIILANHLRNYTEMGNFCTFHGYQAAGIYKVSQGEGNFIKSLIIKIYHQEYI